MSNGPENLIYIYIGYKYGIRILKGVLLIIVLFTLFGTLFLLTVK